MADYLGEFNDVSGGASELERQRDFDDLQLELSGALGKMPRFLSAEAREAIREAKTGESRLSRSLSVLDMLLIGPT
ncbi:hypothetical protein [Labrenzia sp. CE80]|uniref:hypothetical protein n=1 Tax=Labrenzia sp. CE80 TaxID=1788986 RepID=UPI00129B5C8F|nr:hypothetical protein [Labrenzia sp. CE80]